MGSQSEIWKLVPKVILNVLMEAPSVILNGTVIETFIVFGLANVFVKTVLYFVFCTLDTLWFIG